jgi:hypothetical protein
MSAVAEEVSDEARVAGRADAWSLIREMLKFAAQRDGQWAGIPMPLPDEELVVEPEYPMSAEAVSILGATMRKAVDVEPAEKPRNVFWSSHWRREVVVWNRADGKVEHGIHMGHNSFELMLRTAGMFRGVGRRARAEGVAAARREDHASPVQAVPAHRAFPRALGAQRRVVCISPPAPDGRHQHGDRHDENSVHAVPASHRLLRAFACRRDGADR